MLIEIKEQQNKLSAAEKAALEAKNRWRKAAIAAALGGCKKVKTDKVAPNKPGAKKVVVGAATLVDRVRRAGTGLTSEPTSKRKSLGSEEGRKSRLSIGGPRKSLAVFDFTIQKDISKTAELCKPRKVRKLHHASDRPRAGGSDSVA
jgi:hypothetical protein